MTMATPTQDQTGKPTGYNNRNRRQRGRGKNQTAATRETTMKPDTTVQDSSLSGQITESVSSLTIQEANLCWICTEPVKYFSVSECNHRTCHVCALRLRALYKRMDCTFCKHPQPTLIYTRSPDQLYDTFTPEQIPFKDAKLSIFFETQDMMEDTLLLLRFNCPDSDCDFVGHGWGDLKMHVRSTHNCLVCDLCIRHKKVFAHEHVMYQPSQLPIHLPSVPRRNPNKNALQDQNIEGGIHPLCEFCRDCFFSDDELFAHMREKHEECFVCKRVGVRDQYFQDYGSLDHHFNNAHYPCKDSSCRAQKFVVFGSLLDLKAHMVEQHGHDMSTKDKKDLRRLDAPFEYESREDSTSRQTRPRQQRDRERERELPESGHSSRRREAFGVTLTPETSSLPPTQSPHKPFSIEQSQLSEAAGVNAERHSAFIARIINLTSNLSNAVPAIEAAIRSYRSNESSPRDLINTIFSVANRNIDDTASLMSALVEILDDEEKRRALLASWNSFKIEQRQQFPELTPSLGSGYAGVASGRIINIKHSTTSRSSSQSSGQVWERVAQAAKSTSTGQTPPSRPTSLASSSKPGFPSLSATKNTTAQKRSTSTTPWSSGGTAMPRSERSLGPASSSQALSTDLFPTLPSLAKSPRVPLSGNQSLKNIMGDNPAPSSTWGQKKDEDGQAESSTALSSVDTEALNASKGKRKKGKEKQTLFVIGSFPT